MYLFSYSTWATYIYLVTAKCLLCSLFEPVSNFLDNKTYLSTQFCLFSFMYYHNSTCIRASGIVSWNNKQSGAGSSPEGIPRLLPSAGTRSGVRGRRWQNGSGSRAGAGVMSLQYGGHRRRFYKNSFAGFNMSLVTVQLTVTEYLPLCHLYSVHTRLNKQVESGFILHSDFLNSSLLAKVFLPKIRRMVTSILGILFVFTLPKYCS